jgi:cell wall assembly regulator SMI1
MTPKKLLEQVASGGLWDRRGRLVEVKVIPPVTAEEIAVIEGRLRKPLPAEIRDLLLFASGFELDSQPTRCDFTGSYMFALEEAFPHCFPLLGDGDGNYWFVDIRSDNGEWAGVFYGCHDPRTIVFQAPSISAFLEQIFAAAEGKPDQLRSVSDQPLSRVCLRPMDSNSDADQALLTGVAVPDGEVSIADLRAPNIGDGFRFDDAALIRPGADPVFLLVSAPLHREAAGRRQEGRWARQRGIARQVRIHSPFFRLPTVADAGRRFGGPCAASSCPPSPRCGSLGFPVQR